MVWRREMAVFGAGGHGGRSGYTVWISYPLLGKMLESPTLQKQAAGNTKEQFATSPDLNSELLNAIMGALDAHTLMSTQALNSVAVRLGIKAILLEQVGLWERLRAGAGGLVQ